MPGLDKHPGGQFGEKDLRPVVILDGNHLTVEEIVAIGVGDVQIALDPGALERCRASRRFLEEEVAAQRIIYGVNTSFGPMCNKIIEDREIETLQVNLIRSHAAGLGDPLKPYIAIGVLAVRLNTLVKGYSGVRIELLEFMRDLINRGVAPYIPECGSVGASGDLIHLAHMALGMIGEGRVYYRDQLRFAAEVFAELGIAPIRLSFKEGIALMNGTSAMTAIAAFALFGAKKLLRLSCVTGAFSLEIFGGIDDAFDEDLHRVKPHPGQLDVAATVRNLYQGSKNITLRADMHDLIRKQKKDGLVFETSINVQDVYSVRCTPQVLAPVAEAIDLATRTVEIEANSSNDNPIIIPEQKKVIHGGNFHGQSIGFVMDSLCIAMATLSTLSERRINKYLDKSLNEGLPEFLIPGTLGLTMGFMGAQYLATSTTAENRQLAAPVSTHSISCNASNQDVVSMGTVAARKAFKSVSNAKHILTLEVLADLQALSFRNAAGLGVGTRRIYEILSAEFTPYDNERVFHEDLVKFRKILFSSQLFDDLSIYWAA
ncbi:HAL/PAL/TAL family ammonia-lyase [Geoalkalibacter halelectricus]|uniref:Aromatic amino acid ammonia-lyase n=1 Tax=Geoalkalibacter halelectricus TaxID=2847045 RepID=A0ABY5ZJD5_9BACT|nr:aromatic amino acid ammonia-lyase [Geoalkalibacter halelectricus]MDO3379811.1 aromatic amino acid ammonia-lyase [Geoalkalibacter halelectricus]UWZ79245.1 aromatic amino acid ammonia-lyase [Geoalkalibacter halelectricus]